MKKLHLCSFIAIVVALAAAAPLEAAFLQPLTSFGGDGWLAPGEIPHLTTDHLQRGLAYNPTANQLYLVDRSGGNNVRVLDGDTGAVVTSLDMTGVLPAGAGGGGTFAVNMVGLADDGAIYVGNLALNQNFKIYRWANNVSPPTLVYDDLTGLSRVGDSFAVIGSGADTRIIASGSGHNGIAVFDTSDGVSFSLTSANAIAGVPAGGFRLGIDFIDANTAIGQQTGSQNIYTADLANSTGQTYSVNVTGEAPLGYYGPQQLLATVDVATSHVRLYDASDLSLLTSSGFLEMQNLTTSYVANTNGTGDVAFGVAPDGTLRLYALNTNNGIQAFVVIPEPSAVALGLAGLLGLAACRRRH